MKQIAIGLRVRVDKCERIVEQLENNGLLTREEFEENGETIEHLYPHNRASRLHSSEKSTKRVKELRKRTTVSPPFHPREQIQSTETDTESVRKNARADAKKNGFETDHQQPKSAQSQPAEHRQPAPAEAPKAVNGHPANLPDSEPFVLDDPWGDLQKDIVFKTETASKGIIPNPDCNALREWKKDGLDVNVVRQVVMEGIKRKPVGTLFYFDKPVRERDAQLKAARSRPSVAAKPEPHIEDNAVCDAHETSSPDSICTSEWQIALKFFKLTDNWPDHLGPAPGRSGCRVPVDLLECYGLVKTGRRSA